MRIDAAYARLAAKLGADVRAFAVKEIVGEIDFFIKQLFRVKTAREMMLAQASAFAAAVRARSASRRDSAWARRHTLRRRLRHSTRTRE